MGEALGHGGCSTRRFGLAESWDGSPTRRLIALARVSATSRDVLTWTSCAPLISGVLT